MSDERRKFSRIHFDGACTLIFEKKLEHHDFEASMIDISLNGALICITPCIIDLEEEQVQLQLQLNDSSTVLLLNGFVSHQQEKLLGIQFTKLSLETISHLKRLIELNVGDSQGIHREFTQLIEQHINHKE